MSLTWWTKLVWIIEVLHADHLFLCFALMKYKPLCNVGKLSYIFVAGSSVCSFLVFSYSQTVKLVLCAHCSALIFNSHMKMSAPATRWPFSLLTWPFHHNLWDCYKQSYPQMVMILCFLASKHWSREIVLCKIIFMHALWGVHGDHNPFLITQHC